jgi:hypothetical protein
MHYENVRNKFAKDVGFNYRRGDSNRRYVETLEVEDKEWARQI